jgi:hypothetical protein
MVSEEKPMKPNELSKFARPVAGHLRSVMQDGTRSPMERVQAALGIQALQAFIPDVPIRPARLVAPLSVPDDPGSEVEPFSGLTAAEKSLADQSLGLMEEFFTAGATEFSPDSRVLVLMEITAMLFADLCRRAQTMGVSQLDLDAQTAKVRMQDLILNRMKELLRQHDLSLS